MTPSTNSSVKSHEIQMFYVIKETREEKNPKIILIDLPHW